MQATATPGAGSGCVGTAKRTAVGSGALPPRTRRAGPPGSAIRARTPTFASAPPPFARRSRRRPRLRRRPSPVYPSPMSRGSAYALLAVLGAGVFLAGLELMITAVALPTIITDLVAQDPDRPGQTAFSELRRASWIVNGYLLAYVVAMPLAGRLADVWGARRLFLGGLVVFIDRVARRRPRPDDRRAHRRTDHPGDRRRRSSCRSERPRPRTCSRATRGRGRSGVIGALTFLGMAAGPFVGAAILGGLDIDGALTAAARRRRGPDP